MACAGQASGHRICGARRFGGIISLGPDPVGNWDPVGWPAREDVGTRPITAVLGGVLQLGVSRWWTSFRIFFFQKAVLPISFEITLGSHHEESNGGLLSHVNPGSFMWPKPGEAYCQGSRAKSIKSSPKSQT